MRGLLVGLVVGTLLSPVFAVLPREGLALATAFVLGFVGVLMMRDVLERRKR